jgi:xylulose-5-phosphate/fructose-6-phosphate phosphoketolase
MDVDAIERTSLGLADVLSPEPKSYLGADEQRLTNAYWRAANYLSVGQIYLYDNPLLQEPL